MNPDVDGWKGMYNEIRKVSVLSVEPFRKDSRCDCGPSMDYLGPCYIGGSRRKILFTRDWLIMRLEEKLVDEYSHDTTLRAMV